MTCSFSSWTIVQAKPGAVDQAILVQELGSSRGGQGGPPQPGQGSQSAQAARHVLQAVHTFVAFTQIQQVTMVTLFPLITNEDLLHGIFIHCVVLFANKDFVGQYTHH